MVRPPLLSCAALTLLGASPFGMLRGQQALYPALVVQLVLEKIDNSVAPQDILGEVLRSDGYRSEFKHIP
jgi:hypothetical protein